MSKFESTDSGAAEVPPFERWTAPEGVVLLVWNTDKFKTFSVRVTLVEPLDEAASERAVVAALLRRGCARLPSLRALSRELERLFGASLAVHVHKFGERQLTVARLRVVDDRRLGGSGESFAAGVGLLGEILTDPMTEGDGFAQEPFELERDNLLKALRGLRDDKFTWAEHRFVQEMFRGEPFARSEWGEEADVRELDRGRALARHRERLRRRPILVFAVGPAGGAERAALEGLVDRLARDREEIEWPAEEEQRDPSAPRTLIEREEVAQTKIHIGYRLQTRDLDEARHHALALYNTMLGGGSGLSKLFKEVREKRSLAYYAHSSLDRVKGFLSLTAGVGAERWRQASDVMRDQVRSLAQGSFEERELDVARVTMLSDLRSVHDSPARAIGLAQSAWLTGRSGDVERICDVISRLDAGAVTDVAHLPREDLTYVLEGTMTDAH